jgi:hypothetical protein
MQKVRRRAYLFKGRRFDTRWCWLLAAGWMASGCPRDLTYLAIQHEIILE